MTLQKLHELTGKVLKERPELATVILSIDGDAENLLAMIYYEGIQTLPSIIALDGEKKKEASPKFFKQGDILWQAN